MANKKFDKAAAAAKKVIKESDGSGFPVVAVHKINRTIPPGLVFVPESAEAAANLLASGAAREPNESELAFFEKTNPSAPPAPVMTAAEKKAAEKAAAEAQKVADKAAADAAAAAAAGTDPLG